jgi:putative peptidoglycan lipid II flippase
MAALGLCAVAGLRITVQAFYSLGDVRTPVKAAFASFILNAVLGFILMRWLGTPGLTLAASMAAWLQWILLFFFLKRRVGKLPLAQFIRETCLIFLSASAMALLLWPIGLLNLWSLNGSVILRFLYVFGAISIGLVIYVGVAYFLGVKELRTLAQKLILKVKRSRPDDSDALI